MARLCTWLPARAVGISLTVDGCDVPLAVLDADHLGVPLSVFLELLARQFEFFLQLCVFPVQPVNLPGHVLYAFPGLLPPLLSEKGILLIR